MSGLAKWLGGVAVNPTLRRWELQLDKRIQKLGRVPLTQKIDIQKKANTNSNENKCHQRGSIPSPKTKQLSRENQFAGMWTIFLLGQKAGCVQGQTSC